MGTLSDLYRSAYPAIRIKGAKVFTGVLSHVDSDYGDSLGMVRRYQSQPDYLPDLQDFQQEQLLPDHQPLFQPLLDPLLYHLHHHR